MQIRSNISRQHSYVSFDLASLKFQRMSNFSPSGPYSNVHFEVSDGDGISQYIFTPGVNLKHNVRAGTNWVGKNISLIGFGSQKIVLL